MDDPYIISIPNLDTPTFHAGTTIEYFNLMSDSFCGTTISNPEASLHWALTGKTIFTPLRKKPNKKRKEVFKYMLWSGGLGGISTKSAYGLLDPNGSGKFVAGTVCYAPYTYPPKNNVYNSVNGKKLLMEHGIRKLPDYFTKDFSVRSNACNSVQEKGRNFIMNMYNDDNNTGKMPYYYIQIFAVSPYAQGKKYGQRLMSYIKALADKKQVKILLETVGDRNENFYKRNGFITAFKETIKGKPKDDYIEMLVMIRSPNDNTDYRNVNNNNNNVVSKL